MKNSAIAAIVFLAFSFASCSSDSSDGSTELSGPKINTVHEKIYDGTTIDSDRNYVFNYENSALNNVVITGDGETTKVEFFYSGSKISSIKFYSGSTLFSTENCTYTGDLLTSVIGSDDTEPQERTEYLYSGNTLLQKDSYYYDAGSWYQNQSYAYTFNTLFNIDQQIRTEHFGLDNYIYKASYDYDTFNNPFKNMNPYLRVMVNFESIDIISNNNVTKQYSYESATSTTPTISHNYEIVYNAANYPISIKKYAAADNELISEMMITYTE